MSIAVVSDPAAADGLALFIPSGQNFIAATSPLMDLQQYGDTFTLSFKAHSSTGGRELITDLFPDTLPQNTVTLTTTPTDYVIPIVSSHADMAACKLRFFGGAQPGDITVNNIKLEVGSTKTGWTMKSIDILNSELKITADNVTTHIARDTIKTLQLAPGSVTSAVYEFDNFGIQLSATRTAYEMFPPDNSFTVANSFDVPVTEGAEGEYIACKALVIFESYYRNRNTSTVRYYADCPAIYETNVPIEFGPYTSGLAWSYDYITNGGSFVPAYVGHAARDSGAFLNGINGGDPSGLLTTFITSDIITVREGGRYRVSCKLSTENYHLDNYYGAAFRILLFKR